MVESRGNCRCSGCGRLLALVLAPLAAAFAPLPGSSALLRAQELSPAEAIERAAETSSGLAQQRLQISQAERSASHTWNRFLPTLSVSAGFGRAVPPTPLGEGEWQYSSSVSTGIEIDIPAIVGDDSEEIALERQRLAYEEQYWQLRTEVLRSYFQLVLDRAEAALTRRQVEAAGRRAEEAQRQYENGVISEYQMLQRRVSYENQRPELAALEDELELAERAFRRHIGAAPGSELALRDELPSIGELPSAEALIDRYADQSLTVQQAELSLESAQPSIEDRILPSLSLSYTAQLGGPPEWNRNGSISLSARFPVHQLFPGSPARVARQNAADERESLRIALDRAAKEAEVAIEEQVRAAVRAREQIAAVERNLELAERAYALAEQQYDAGAVGLQELEDAELELRQAELTVARQKNTFITAIVELEQALGDTLPQTPW